MEPPSDVPPPAREPRVLLGVAGSIAAYKAVEVARRLQDAGLGVQVAMTEAATRFVTPITFEAITARPVVDDPWARRGGEIAHVERAHEVDLLLIAPATAQTMARLAHGFADDALCAVALSTTAPILIAPAMEHGMWNNPATQSNLQTLLERGVSSVGPDCGHLASGRRGDGRMASPEAIVAEALKILGPRDLDGESVVITAGPTWERIDPVRVLANRSTGAMGIALAEAAAQRGAAVRLVLGPTHLAPRPHPHLSVIRIESALEMLAAASEGLDERTVVIGAAAVSDFRPASPREHKLKRSAPDAQTIRLEENPDIIATLAARCAARTETEVRRRPILVGFAAETERVTDHAQSKRERKGLDVVVGNEVGRSRGFGLGDTEVVLVSKMSEPKAYGPATKARVAHFIWDHIVELRRGA